MLNKSEIYYNENDKFHLGWIRQLIAEGLIRPGDINGRSILEEPPDLSRYTTCHFFAGIGGWEYALQNSRWPATKPVWTGSCPCQPFSAAGKKKVDSDERHLWPRWFELIREYRPPAIFGEQVQSEDGRIWLAGVFSDLETLGYRTAAMDLCAASQGAPHRRQRLYWVADAEHSLRRTIDGDRENGRDRPHDRRPETHGESGTCGEIRGMVDAQDSHRRSRIDRAEKGTGPEKKRRREPAGGGDPERMGQPDKQRLSIPEQETIPGKKKRELRRTTAEPGQTLWAESQWIYCKDDRYRRIPIKPALSPLAARLPGRVGLLRGAGNSIVPQIATEFINTYLEILEDEWNAK